MELVIEVITRGGKVLSLHKFSGAKVTLGRAFDNDLILQEEHVCPYHAELSMDQEGQVVIEDLDSINGIKDHSNRHLGESIALQSGDVFVLGKNYLRVYRADHPVVEAKKINIFEDAARYINHWYWALLAIAFFFVINLLSEHAETITEVKWSSLIVQSLFVVLGVAFLPLIVAGASRVFKKDVKFFTIVTFSFATMSLFLLLTMFGSILNFNWGGSSFVWLGGQIIEYGLSFIFFWGAFYLASNLSLRKVTITSASLTLLILAVIQIQNLSDDNVKSFPRYSAKVLPQAFLVNQPTAVESFSEETNNLFKLASEEADRRNQEAEQTK